MNGPLAVASTEENQSFHSDAPTVKQSNARRVTQSPVQKATKTMAGTDSEAMTTLEEMLEDLLRPYSGFEKQLVQNSLHTACLEEINYDVNGFENLGLTWTERIPRPEHFDFARAHELVREIIQAEGGPSLLAGVAGILNFIPPPPQEIASRHVSDPSALTGDTRGDHETDEVGAEDAVDVPAETAENESITAENETIAQARARASEYLALENRRPSSGSVRTVGSGVSADCSSSLTVEHSRTTIAREESDQLFYGSHDIATPMANLHLYPPAAVEDDGGNGGVDDAADRVNGDGQGNDNQI